MVAAGALVGLWILQRELRRAGLPPQISEAAVIGLVGGLLGAKLLWTIEHLGDAEVLDLVLSRGGMSWYGGALGGVGTGLLVLSRKRWPIVSTLSAATPALAVGHALGRIGCFLVGDDYGRPSSLPWAVAFPQGLPPTSDPVHPTQLYEAGFLGGLAWALVRWRRLDVADRVVLSRYLIYAAGFRFLLEFIRINDRIALGLTLAQWISAGLIAAGLAMTRRPRWAGIKSR